MFKKVKIIKRCMGQDWLVFLVVKVYLLLLLIVISLAVEMFVQGNKIALAFSCLSLITTIVLYRLSLLISLTMIGFWY